MKGLSMREKRKRAISPLGEATSREAQMLELCLERLDRLEEMISDLGERIPVHQPSGEPFHEVMVVEQMDRETVRERVLKHIKKTGTTDIVELHREIKCDIAILAEILDELVTEGTVGE